MSADHQVDERILIVSSDGHVAAPPETYRPYLEKRFHAHLIDLEADFKVWVERFWAPKDLPKQALEIMDVDGAIESGGRKGGFDLHRRLREMNREGITAEVVHPSTNNGMVPFFGSQGRQYPADLRTAGVRAYHRWLADMIADSNGRVYGIATAGTCLDMDQTLAELRWAADHGYVSVSVPGTTYDPNLPPLVADYFEPFWAACEDLGLVLSVHAGYGGRQGEILSFVERAEAEAKAGAQATTGMDALAGAGASPNPLAGSHGNRFAKKNKSPLELGIGARRVIWQLMVGGVFDRHPGLHIALTETRVDWLPATLSLLDELLPVEHPQMRLKPSEYWAKHFYAGVSSIHRAEVELREQIGVRQIMFGTDYPHLEATWPNTPEWIRDAFSGLTDEVIRDMLGGNAIRCYQLDEGKLRGIADQIGLRWSEVFGGGPVPDPLLETFHLRAGYLRPAEVVNPDEVRGAVREDLAVLQGVGRGA